MLIIHIQNVFTRIKIFWFVFISSVLLLNQNISVCRNSLDVGDSERFIDGWNAQETQGGGHAWIYDITTNWRSQVTPGTQHSLSTSSSS